LPSGVVTTRLAVSAPLSITLIPAMVTSSTPSGALMVKVPVAVVDSFVGSEPSERSSSSTLTSPPLALGVRLEMVTSWSLILMIKVAVDLSPSASSRV
jgi:hypothetical protein